MDKQITGLAGEYFVAAELLKRGWQVAITLGNAKAIDMIATNEEGNTTHRIQVKTLRTSPNVFTLQTEKVKPEDFYIFVYLNGEDEQPSYFIVKGEELIANLKHYYGSSLGRADNRETVNNKPLQEHKNRWDKL
jgi:PD-(D/E)XK endonuclease